MSNRRAVWSIECHRDDLDPAELAAIAEVVLSDLGAQLQLDVSALHPVRVIVSDGPSSVVGREIRVGPRRAGRGYTASDWFELLLAHELTHLLVRDEWGLPPALVWEGLAVHLGDDRVRTRLVGTSYHAWCRALDELGLTLPLGPLLRASTYYRRRPDWRVDLQAGSFCAFLLRAHGPVRLARFVRESVRPTDDPPEAVLDPILRRCLGAELDGLHTQWLDFLRSEAPREPRLLDRLRARRLADDPEGREHCDRCFAPLDGHACPAH